MTETTEQPMTGTITIEWWSAPNPETRTRTDGSYAPNLRCLMKLSRRLLVEIAKAY